MTNDADKTTPFDAAIDAVAQAMTRGRTPDLRSRVAERLDRGAQKVVWWRPVAAAVVVLLGVLVWWPARDSLTTDPVERRPRSSRSDSQRVPAPASRAIEPPRVAPNPLTARVPRRSRAPRPPELNAVEAARALPPLEVASIAIDSLAIETAVPLDEVEMSELVVETLDVEPLPRSNP